MPYAIITEDRPDGLALRQEKRDEHLAYLDRNKNLLLAAGALIEDDGTGGKGGILIVDTDDRTVAQALIDEDPFTTAGLFASVRVVRWRKAFFDKEKLV